MATTPESSPISKDSKAPGSQPGKESNSQGSLPESDSKSLSSLTESNLERSILRRGLATPQELDACKAYRAKLAAKDQSKGLLESWLRPRSSPRASQPGSSRRWGRATGNSRSPAT